MIAIFRMLLIAKSIIYLGSDIHGFEFFVCCMASWGKPPPTKHDPSHIDTRLLFVRKRRSHHVDRVVDVSEVAPIVLRTKAKWTFFEL